jgi:hypothetical protein
MGLVSVWFGFFCLIFLFFRFGFSVSSLWNWNQTKPNIFLNILIGLIGFFSWFDVFGYFFRFNYFFSFFVDPYI